MAQCANYGALYQWDEAMQYSAVEGAKGICPVGWHVPSDANFTSLTRTVIADPGCDPATGCTPAGEISKRRRPAPRWLGTALMTLTLPPSPPVIGIWTASSITRELMVSSGLQPLTT